MAKIWGGTVEEIADTPFTDYLHPDALPIIADRYNRRQKSENVPSRYETVLQHKNGRKIYVDVNVGTLNYLGHEAEIAIVHDITERKIAENAIKESEQNFRNFLDTSSIGIRIRDAEEHVIYLNRAFMDIFGYQTLEEAQTSIPMKLYAPESYAEYLARSEKISRGETVPNKVEVDIVRKDGTIRHVQVFGRRVHINGKIQAQTLYIDITTMKQAEEILKTSEQNLHTALDKLPVGCRITDIDDNTLYLNQAFLNIFGYDSAEEVKAKPPLKDFYTPDSYADYLVRKEKILRGEPRKDPVDVDIIRKDGSLRHLQLFHSELIWNGKQEFQTVYYDVTERKQAKEALKQSEQNFRNSLEHSLIGIRIVDEDWHTLYANRIFLDMFGYESTIEADTHSPEKLYTPEEYQRFLERKAKRRSGEPVPETLEIDTRHKSGSVRRIQTTRKEIFWDGKQQYQLFYNDITERKQAEDALKASEQNFRNSMDNSSIGIRISDKKGNNLYSNQALLDIFGYRNLEEIQNNPPQNFYSPECYTAWKSRNEKLLRDEPMPKQVAIEIIRKDGIAKYLDVSMREVFWNGKQNYETLYNDITEQKKIERALRESEEKYRTIFESANDIIILLDTGGIILDVNSRLTDIGGYGTEELIGKNISELTNIINKENMAVVVGNLMNILTGSGVISYRVEMTKKNHELIYLEINAIPIRKDGNTTGALAILRDVTERKKSEEQIREQKALTDRILENTPDSMAVVGKNGQVIMVNKAFSHAFELTEDKVKDVNIREIIPVPVFIDTLSQVLINSVS